MWESGGFAVPSSVKRASPYSVERTKRCLEEVHGIFSKNIKPIFCKLRMHWICRPSWNQPELESGSLSQIGIKRAIFVIQLTTVEFSNNLLACNQFPFTFHVCCHLNLSIIALLQIVSSTFRFWEAVNNKKHIHSNDLTIPLKSQKSRQKLGIPLFISQSMWEWLPCGNQPQLHSARKWSPGPQ